MRRDDELLEPILPKSPPTADDLRLEAVVDPEPPARSGGAPWERWMLIGCAVAATLSLVLIAVRLESIARDQRVQTCQTRVFAAQQLGEFDGTGGRQAQRRFAEELARCVGMKVPATSSD